MYKITYPNGKISIGQDRPDTLDSLGSPTSRLIAQDCAREQRRDFTIRKEILMEFLSETDQREITCHEVKLIVAYQANDPAKGNNCHPTCRG